MTDLKLASKEVKIRDFKRECYKKNATVRFLIPDKKHMYVKSMMLNLSPEADAAQVA